jgi:hypothetical protein
MYVLPTVAVRWHQTISCVAYLAWTIRKYSSTFPGFTFACLIRTISASSMRRCAMEIIRIEDHKLEAFGEVYRMLAGYNDVLMHGLTPITFEEFLVKITTHGRDKNV